MSMRFRNPSNGYIENASLAPLWCLLFGGFYFAAKGVWTHSVAGFGLAVFTFGFSWIIYPFFASQVMRTHYLRRGWLEVREPDGGPSGWSAEGARSQGAAPIQDEWDQRISRYASETAQQKPVARSVANASQAPAGFGKRQSV